MLFITPKKRLAFMREGLFGVRTARHLWACHSWPVPNPPVRVRDASHSVSCVVECWHMLENKPKHLDCQAPFYCARPSFADELPESWTEGYKFWLLSDDSELGQHHPLSPVIIKVGIRPQRNKTEGLGNPLLGFLLR